MRCILVFIGGLAVGILTGIGIHAAGEGDDQEAGQETIGEDEEAVIQEGISDDGLGDDHEGGFGGFMPSGFRSFLE